MHPKQIKRIASHPKSAMDYQASGRVPAMELPLQTPLWVLLDSIPPRLRAEIKGVKLNPKLGYNNGQLWQTAEQLFRWLGGNESRGSWESSPADGYADRRFQKRLTVEDLLQYSNNYPSKEYFSKYGIKLT